jgi:hypothetical protein
LSNEGGEVFGLFQGLFHSFALGLLIGVKQGGLFGGQPRQYFSQRGLVRPMAHYEDTLPLLRIESVFGQKVVQVHDPKIYTPQ